MTQAPRILLVDAEEIVPEVTKVNLRGRLDASGVASVETTFARLAQTQKYLVVDLSRVTFIASTGLRTLISGARTVAAGGGRMAFLQPDPSVEAVLISSGIDQVIPVFQTLADAVCSVCQIDGDGDDLPGHSLPFSVDIDRTNAGIGRVGAWVDELSILLNLSQRTEYALRLSLEEVVTRIITHGQPKEGVNADRISLRLIADAGRLSVTVQDLCAPYNPLTESTTAESPAEDALGINLLRQHARNVTWSRVGRFNRLAFTIPR